MDFPADVPRLTSGAVILRAAAPDDADGVVEQCADPESRRWTTVPVPYGHGDAVQFLTEIIPAGWRSGSAYTFVVEVRDPQRDGEPRFAGTISLRDEGEARAEVAFGSHPWVRGRGAMTEAVRLLLEWGFETLGLRTVLWQANVGNWASRRLAWRLGFSYAGTLEQWLPQRGELLDGWVGILRVDEPMLPRHPWYDVPRIAGADVVLRGHQGTDVPRVVSGARDAAVRRWLGQFPQPYQPVHAEQFFEVCRERAARGEDVHWTVADPRTDEFLGDVAILRVVGGREGELGYWMHPEGRGRGLATQAARLALRHAFAPVEAGGLGLGRVRALAAVGNDASRRVLEKAGMTLQGRERRSCIVEHGLLADGLVFDILPHEL